MRHGWERGSPPCWSDEAKSYSHKDVVSVQDAAQRLAAGVDLVEVMVEHVGYDHLSNTQARDSEPGVLLQCAHSNTHARTYTPVWQELQSSLTEPSTGPRSSQLSEQQPGAEGTNGETVRGSGEPAWVTKPTGGGGGGGRVKLTCAGVALGSSDTKNTSMTRSLLTGSGMLR